MPRKLRLQERIWDEARERCHRVGACRLRRILQFNCCGSGEVRDPAESYEGEGSPQSLSLNKNGCGVLAYPPHITHSQADHKSQREVSSPFITFLWNLTECKRIGGTRSCCILMCKLPNRQLQSTLLLSCPSTMFQLMATDCQSPV